MLKKYYKSLDHILLAASALVANNAVEAANHLNKARQAKDFSAAMADLDRLQTQASNQIADEDHITDDTRVEVELSKLLAAADEEEDELDSMEESSDDDEDDDEKFEDEQIATTRRVISRMRGNKAQKPSKTLSRAERNSRIVSRMNGR